jgi:hypothetical protein
LGAALLVAGCAATARRDALRTTTTSTSLPALGNVSPTSTSTPTPTPAPTTPARPKTTRPAAPRPVVTTTVAPRPAPHTTSAAPVRNCDPAYPNVCLRDGIGDYDCAGGSGNGPNYVRGPIKVLPPDPFGLDRDGDGIGCE